MARLRIWVKSLERKEDIRKRIRKKRRLLTSRQREEGTAVITERILSHPWFREAEDIYCYIDFDGEPGTRAVIEEAWRLGKRVWAPKVLEEQMDFYQITTYDTLTPGAFGIPEPSGESEPASGKDGLMIMPGIAFDRQRNRVGYGKGYYDRYLRDHPGLRTIAAAFACQIVGRIEAEEQDIAPMALVTEQDIYQEGKEKIYEFAKRSGDFTQRY